MKHPFIVIALAAAATLGLESGPFPVFSEAQAQQMGNQPWGFNPRNRSLAAQFQFQDKLVNGNGHGSSNSDGLAALNQYVTTYNSSSTSIGNLNEVTQILSGGSTGTVGQSTDQWSQGSQGSSASTDVQIDNSVEITTGDNTVVVGESSPPAN